MTKALSGRWDILLADLSLILFIIALGGLVGAQMQNRELSEKAQLDVAPSQALYRSVEGGPSITEWLSNQALDPRATLTIFVSYRRDDAAANLSQAAALITEAQSRNVEVRTVVRASDRSDIYASLAFDAAPQ